MLLLVDSFTLKMFTGDFGFFLFKYAYIFQVLSSIDIFSFFFFNVKYGMRLSY